MPSKTNVCQRRLFSLIFTCPQWLEIVSSKERFFNPSDDVFRNHLVETNLNERSDMRKKRHSSFALAAPYVITTSIRLPMFIWPGFFVEAGTQAVTERRVFRERKTRYNFYQYLFKYTARKFWASHYPVGECPPQATVCEESLLSLYVHSSGPNNNYEITPNTQKTTSIYRGEAEERTWTQR
jgi:hypothetical protein